MVSNGGCPESYDITRENKDSHDYTKEEFQNIIVEAMPQRPQRVHEMSKEKLAFTFFFGLISRMTMVCV